MQRSLILITFITLLPALGSNLASAAPSATATPSDTAVATFAGGCFWCMEPPYDKLDGVISTISGYMGGHQKNPTYKSVSAGRSGHTEVVQVTYNPAKVSYEKLVQVFWRNIDPVARDRQFCDAGSQYRSAIFYHDEQQERIARSSKQALEQDKSFAGEIVTEISPARRFYRAEKYHQDYYKKNPLRYKYYRHGCGRDKRLKELWGES